MRAVAIRVRKIAGLGDEVVGTDLINRSFGTSGPLTDPSAVKAEQEGTRALFAGAYAVLRNPAGHRQVDYSDLSEAGKVVQTASLLMRIIASRTGCSPPHGRLRTPSPTDDRPRGRWPRAVPSTPQNAPRRPFTGDGAPWAMNGYHYR